MNKINNLCISVVLLATTMTVHAQTAYPTRAVPDVRNAAQGHRALAAMLVEGPHGPCRGDSWG